MSLLQRNTSRLKIALALERKGLKHLLLLMIILCFTFAPQCPCGALGGSGLRDLMPPAQNIAPKKLPVLALFAI